MVSVRLTKEQEKKIKTHNITRSEFIRRAVDFYLLYLEDPYTNILLVDLERWIQEKKVTSVTHMNTNVTQCNTDVPDMNTNVLICNTDNTDVTQNNSKTQHKTTQNNMKTKIQKELPMLQRILNNPLNNETIPDTTLKVISKKYALSKSSIEAWIVENKEWIKTGKFTEDNV